MLELRQYSKCSHNHSPQPKENMNPIDERRRILSGIVYSKTEPFTAQEIIDEYRRKMGHCIVDGYESVRDFLRGLESYGGLKCQHGIYTVLQ